MTEELPWWREATIYHIYPRSFQDSDGDGVGDLQGIINRLDYLNDGTEHSLGVDAIWLSPIYPSPLKDFGYDVSDFTDVDPTFGDLATFDRLVEEAHRRQVRVLIDFVLNHTSDRHPWFLDSRASATSARRDWYIWRDPPPDGGPPNNWNAVFGGPAWEFDAATGQYYLHSYLPEQPDLNWRNAEVVEAMGDVLRFWMRRGVDGFRLDAVGRIAKHPDLADNPVNPAHVPGGPEPPFLIDHNYLHPDGTEMVRAIRRVLDEFPDRVAVGEVYAPLRELSHFYGAPALDGLHLMFNFQLIRKTPSAPFIPWNASSVAAAILEAEEDLPSGTQACFALANHDVPRFITRHDADGAGEQRARAGTLLLLGLRGTPCLYYGEELGMRDVPVPPGQAVDPVGRDGARTPMPWDGSPGRGFTEASPWLPFGPPAINVAAQRDDPESFLSLVRRAIHMRKGEASLRRGSLHTLRVVDDSVVVFTREATGARPALVALNCASLQREIDVEPRFSRLLLASASGVELVDAGHGARRWRLPALSAAWFVH
jgi:alpha-glucosidase